MLGESDAVDFNGSGLSQEEVSLNPGDLLTAALESDEVTDSDLRAVDRALNSMMNQQSASEGKPLMSVEEAEAKLSPDILPVLAVKFKGSLTKMRHLDERDQIF